MVCTRISHSLPGLGVGVATVALLSLLTIACGSEGEGPGSETTAEKIATARDRGPALFADNGCADCHGRNREGSELAPPLTTLEEVWSEENLTQFLLDPRESMARHPGVDGMQGEYPREMPGVVPGTSEADARLLARYLIHQE